MKKIFTRLILSAAVLLSTAGQAMAFTVDGINYTLKNGEAMVTGATSRDITSLLIPATVDYEGKTYPVNAIRHTAFNNYKSLRYVCFEDSDTYISCPRNT